MKSWEGVCNGEEGLQQELKKPPPVISPPPPPTFTTNQEDNASFTVPEDIFEKELSGLTGGFPGAEKGLKDFIQKNPPPKKPPPSSAESSAASGSSQGLVPKPKASELPLLMPGMIAIVKNENSPYYMYCGIGLRSVTLVDLVESSS